MVVAEPRQGEIWWGETQDEKGRPYLIVLRDSAIPLLGKILVAPVTTRIRDIPTEVQLGSEDGLPIDCVANFDNLRVFPKALLTRRVGALALGRRRELCGALFEIAGC